MAIKGLLLGDYISIDDEIRKNATKLYAFGGSPIGNSRVKLTYSDQGLCKRSI